jgi:hypothetical protein
VSRHVLDRLSDHLEGDLAPDEFARVDAHLGECDMCARELREQRETVALLRGLPDPDPPSGFAADVMQRIADEGAPRRRVIEGFRRAAQPRHVAALAAGLAAAVVSYTLVIGEGGLLGPSSDPDPVQIASDSGPAGVPVTGTRGADRPRPSSPVPATPVFSPQQASVVLAGNTSGAPPVQVATPPRYGFVGNAAPEIPMRDLEAEVDALMANPDAFLERVERASATSRRPFVAPLVGYSARRGGVSGVHQLLQRAAAPMAVPASTGR